MNKEQFTAEVLMQRNVCIILPDQFLGNDADCADALQSAILHAFEKLNTFRREACFKTWLTRILINECYQMIHQKRSGFL